MMTSWERVADFRLTLPDQPGELAALAAKLRQADVNLIALSGRTSAGEGAPGTAGGGGAEFHCVPESPDQFRNFAESAEFNAREDRAYFVRGAAGAAIVETLERIASAGINLIAVQGIEQAGAFGCLIWTRPQDWATLERALG